MSPDPACVIVADDREPAAAVLPWLRARPEVALTVARLTVGDYLVEDRWLIERKTLPDLVASIKDGRLFRQGLRLAHARHSGAIILEGRAADLADCGMRREAIQGALVTLGLGFGLPLLRALDAQETAGLLFTIARQARAFAAGNLPRHGQRPRGKARVQSHLLQGLPGIGPARARRLIAHFGSIEAVVGASVAELAAVPGIGAATARAMRWAVEEAPGAYLAAQDWDWPV